MNLNTLFASAVIAGLAILGIPSGVAQQAAPAAAAPALPADPWPRDVSISNAALLIYQPQVNSWVDNKLDFRAAMAIKPTGATEETFGSVFATARTQVDKVERTVVFENLQITKLDFPTLAEPRCRISGRTAEATDYQLEDDLARPAGGIARRSRDQGAAGRGEQYAAAGHRQLCAGDSGPDRRRAGLEAGIRRRALPARHQQPRADPERRDRAEHLHPRLRRLAVVELDQRPMVATARPAAGHAGEPPTRSRRPASSTCSTAARRRIPKPSLANGVPTIFLSQGPTELIVFKGQPDFVPIVGTQLLWASNTTNDVLIDTTNNNYYVLIVGTLVQGDGIDRAVDLRAGQRAAAGLRADSAGVARRRGIATVAGTPQAQEALISQLDSANGDRSAQERPDLHAVLRRSTAVFADCRHAVDVRGQLIGPGDPGQSGQLLRSHCGRVVHGAAVDRPVGCGDVRARGDLHHSLDLAAALRDLRQDLRSDADGRVRRLYAGLPGDRRRAVWNGRVRHGIRLFALDRQHLVSAAVHLRRRGRADLQPLRRLHLSDSRWAWRPRPGPNPTRGTARTTIPAYWGGYPCCATASANVYGHWGNTAYSGTRSWYAGGGVAGTTASGSYYNSRTGTSGTYNAGKQYNANTGNYTRGYDRTATAPRAASGEVARGANYNEYTGQRSTANAASATGAGGSSYNRAGATTAGPEGNAHVGGGSTYNAATGKTNTWGTASVGNNHYADVNGNVYKNTGDGWQQHSSSGWSNSSSASSWGDKESQARSRAAAAFGGGGGFGAAVGITPAVSAAADSVAGASAAVIVSAVAASAAAASAAIASVAAVSVAADSAEAAGVKLSACCRTGPCAVADSF